MTLKLWGALGNDSLSWWMRKVHLHPSGQRNPAHFFTLQLKTAPKYFNQDMPRSLEIPRFHWLLGQAKGGWVLFSFRFKNTGKCWHWELLFHQFCPFIIANLPCTDPPVNGRGFYINSTISNFVFYSEHLIPFFLLQAVIFSAELKLKVLLRLEHRMFSSSFCYFSALNEMHFKKQSWFQTGENFWL